MPFPSLFAPSPGKRARTDQEAIKQGQQLADEQNAELVVHAQDGSIREKDSHGNDPRDIPG